MLLERPLFGFTEIAQAMRTSARQVLVWSKRKHDPLRLYMYQGAPRILPSKLKEWQRRHAKVASLVRIRGWDAIAKRAELSRMAAIRLSEIAEDPLPVTRPTNGLMVWAYESAIDDWRDAHILPYAAHRALRKPKMRFDESSLTGGTIKIEGLPRGEVSVTFARGESKHDVSQRLREALGIEQPEEA